MATTEEVKKLASLARIRVSDAELPKFTAEFDSILSYVGKLDELSLDMKAPVAAPAVRNVFREDGAPDEPGINTEKLAAAFPEKEGNLLKVKQIITHE